MLISGHNSKLYMHVHVVHVIIYMYSFIRTSANLREVYYSSSLLWSPLGRYIVLIHWFVNQGYVGN